MGVLERVVGTLDIQGIVKEVLSVLTVRGLDIYFVVYQAPREEEYTFVGMAYNENAAKLLALDHSKRYRSKVLHLDMGKLVTRLEELGVVEEIR